MALAVDALERHLETASAWTYGWHICSLQSTHAQARLVSQESSMVPDASESWNVPMRKKAGKCEAVASHCDACGIRK